MNSEASSKLDDFILWAGLAFDHYFAARHSDSLTNTRKAGEACCKILLYSKIKDLKKVEELIKNKSYKELINAIIENGAAPRKAINWLETLQIYGNLATHDNKVGSIESEYGYNALKLLTEWLFNEELSIKLPPRLIKHIRPKIHEDELKKRIESLNLELKESNKQGKKLKEENSFIESENLKSGQSELELKKELEQERKRAKELEASIERIKALEEKLNQTIEQANAQKELHQISLSEPYFPKETDPVISQKKRNWKRNLAFSVMSLGILTLLVFSIFKTNNPSVNDNAKKLSGNDSLIKILVLPLAIMQDNPYISFKIEEAIIDELKIQTKEQNIDVEIFFDPANDPPAKSTIEAVNSGKKNNCNMVYYGEIFEKAGGDSVNVNIKYVFIEPDKSPGNEIKGELETKSFSNLTDKNFQKIKNEIGTVVALTKISKIYIQEKWNEVINIINKLRPRLWSLSSQYSIGLYEIGCYRHLGKFEMMVTSGENNYNLYPDSAFAKIDLALIYAHDSVKRYEQSKLLTQSALKEYPDFPKFKTHYAFLLFRHFGDTLKAKILLEQVINKNPENINGWIYLGDLWNLYYRNFDKALQYYFKGLQIDSNNVYILSHVSRIYIEGNLNSAQGELLTKRLLKLDSNNLTALSFMANSGYNKNDYQKAIFYSKKAERVLQKNPDPRFNVIINSIIGLSKYALGDQNMAFSYLEKVVLIDSSQPTINTVLSGLYAGKKRFPEALNLLMVNYKKEYSLSSCYNLGFYFLSNNLGIQAETLAIKYLNEGLKISPNDSLSLNNLGDYYYLKKDFYNASKYYMKLQSLYPDSYYFNFLCGRTSGEMKKIKDWRKFMENCVRIKPDQPEPYAELAISYTWEPNRDLQKGLDLGWKSIDLNPNFSPAYYNLAWIYCAIGIPARGREMFEKAKKNDPSIMVNDPLEQQLVKLGY